MALFIVIDIFERFSPIQVRMLFEMNLSHVLGVIFQYCGGSQLCAIAQVRLIITG